MQRAHPCLKSNTKHLPQYLICCTIRLSNRIMMCSSLAALLDNHPVVSTPLTRPARALFSRLTQLGWNDTARNSYKHGSGHHQRGHHAQIWQTSKSTLWLRPRHHTLLPLHIALWLNHGDVAIHPKVMITFSRPKVLWWCGLRDYNRLKWIEMSGKSLNAVILN